MLAEFLSHPIPAVIILLGILVIVHETGHFVVGKMCGIAVECYSVGFGPRIFGFTRGETEYRLSWIPLGGYVKFVGAHPAEEVPDHLKGKEFLKASLPKRVATIAAGPLANILLAVVAYTILGFSGIPHPPATIGSVMADTPAEKAGLQFDDKIVEINSIDIRHWGEMETLIAASPGKELKITIEREGKEILVPITPQKIETKDMLGNPVTIGRAGISLGRLPSIVTVMDKNTNAARSGIKNGDRVFSISYNGNTQEINYFPELIQALRKATAAEAKSVTLVAAKAAYDDPDRIISEKRDITLSLSGLNPEESINAFGESVGLLDSTLTICMTKGGITKILRSGDRITHMNGVAVKHVYHLQKLLSENHEPKINLSVLRRFQTKTVEVPLTPVEVQRPEGKVTLYTLEVTFWGSAVSPKPVIEQYSNPLLALKFGLTETGMQTAALVVTIGQLLSGNIPLKVLGGPILIAKVAGDSAKRGWQTFMTSLALISINLGLLNLFPIPVLDGGQLVLFSYEAIRRKPISEAAIENFQKVGFVMIMSLVVLAFYNDFSRFWKSILEAVVGTFQ